jgi:hypothetical protein
MSLVRFEEERLIDRNSVLANQTHSFPMTQRRIGFVTDEAYEQAREIAARLPLAFNVRARKEMRTNSAGSAIFPRIFTRGHDRHRTYT